MKILYNIFLYFSSINDNQLCEKLQYNKATVGNNLEKKTGGPFMSIKSELSSLRERNRELRLLIRECSCKLKEEEAKQKAIRDEAEPFAKRKSEFARKFYYEYEQKIEIQAKEIKLCSEK